MMICTRLLKLWMYSLPGLLRIFAIRLDSWVRCRFLLFCFSEEDGSYQEFFSEWKNNVHSQSYWIFKWQNKYKFYIACKNFNHYSPKIKFKIYLLLQFWDKCSKIGSYDLGTRIKLLIESMLDLTLRNEKIEFWKLQIWNFQNSIFSLLRP